MINKQNLEKCNSLSCHQQCTKETITDKETIKGRDPAKYDQKLEENSNQNVPKELLKRRLKNVKKVGIKT